MRRTVQATGAALLSCAMWCPAIAYGATPQEDNARGRQSARAERQQMRFRGMDRNGDGVITRAEWRGNRRAFERRDRNRDGVLSGNEIWVGARGAATDWGGSNLDLVQVFRQEDRNRDGIIALTEWASDPATFARVDSNSDGVITVPEFLGKGWESEVPVGTGGVAEEQVRRDSVAYQAGYDRGLIDGRKAGRGDRPRWDLEGQRELDQPDAGYRPDFGSRTDYQDGYRAGFRVGYRQGFGPR